MGVGVGLGAGVGLGVGGSVGDGVGVGAGVSVGAAVGDGVGVAALVTVMQLENSDVSKGGAFVVAVAVTTLPGMTKAPSGALNITFPDPSVVWKDVPRYVLPSPLPEASQLESEKKSIWKVVLAIEFSDPLTVVAPLVTAEVSTGKFCRLFAPLSASPESFRVTPFASRSMPSPPFE